MFSKDYISEIIHAVVCNKNTTECDEISTSMLRVYGAIYILKPLKLVFDFSFKYVFLFPENYFIFTSSHILRWWQRMLMILLQRSHLYINCLESQQLHKKPPEMFIKKVFLKILQNLQENTCTRDRFLINFFNKTLLKKRLWRRCFPVNFAKFLRTPSLQSTSVRLLLQLGTYDTTTSFHKNQDTKACASCSSFLMDWLKARRSCEVCSKTNTLLSLHWDLPNTLLRDIKVFADDASLLIVHLKDIQQKKIF